MEEKENKEIGIRLLLESLEDANEEVSNLRQREMDLLQQLFNKDKKIKALIKLVSDMSADKQEKDNASD